MTTNFSDRAASYGVVETNGVLDADAHMAHVHEAHDNPRILADRDVVRITRLRLLTERGYPMYDISYCYGELANGQACVITDHPGRLGRRTAKGELIAWAKESGRFAKGMGLLDEDNWSILWG